MKAMVVIPARYNSRRLPGKPILEEAREVTGKYIIQHVYENACRAATVAEVIVATDDVRIADAVQGFGGRAQMTAQSHRSGTDRIAETARDRDYPIVVNVQGDEPEIGPKQIDAVVHLLEEDCDAVMGTLACRITDMETYADPNSVKVVCDGGGRALYFSRAAIPCVRDNPERLIGGKASAALKHLGIYSYRRDFLLKFAGMEPTALEKAEKLEQLRALEAGYRIKVAITDTPALGIDTPADLHRWLEKFRRKQTPGLSPHIS